MKTDLESKKHLKVAFWIGAILFLITAIKSHGYYHADEHYQLIEFAGTLLGTHQELDLAWEYGAQIRPSIQIFIAAAFISSSNFLGIEDPYHQALILRLLTALLSLLVIRKLVAHLHSFFTSKLLRILFIYGSFLIWFIPYLGVRFSSESWSGIFFCLGLVSYWTSISKVSIKLACLGFYFSLAFLFRYQIAFAEIAVLIFWLYKKEISWKGLVYFSVSFLLVLTAGIALDCFYYGEFTLAPWNYFASNILESKAAEFGISPFTYYLEKLLYFPSLPLGILLYTSLITQFVIKRNVVIWAFLVFLIAHSLVGHKEERFLFPLVLLFPFLLFYGYELLLQKTKSVPFRKSILSILAICLAFTSLIGLPTLASVSGGKGHMSLTKYIHDKHEEEVQLIYMNWSHPYMPFGRMAKFYAVDPIESIHIQHICDLKKEMIDPKKTTYLVLRIYDLEHEGCSERLEEFGFQQIKSSPPDWANKLNEFYGGYKNYETVLLYEKVETS
ncbi:MAG: hypothetical protein RIC95_15595 [Vicingaceae bacterium]